jgi:CRP-like cAMP-binding protein
LNALWHTKRPRKARPNSRRHFLSDQCKPKRLGRVKLLDRGPGEPGQPFVLVDTMSDQYLPISAEDRRLWEMFDGNRTVQEILSDYVKTHRTLPLDRIVELVWRLWEAGLLENDPGVGSPESRLSCFLRRMVRIRSFTFPVAAVGKLIGVLQQIRATALICVPVVFLLTVLGICGGCILYTNRLQFGAYLSLLAHSQTRPLLTAFAALAINALLSLGKEVTRALVLTREGVQTGPFGIMMRWGIPIVYQGRTAIAGRERDQRLLLSLSGLWFDCAVTGGAALMWYLSKPSATGLLFLVVVVSLARVIAATCPFLRNDACWIAGDYLDDLRIRRHTFGFLKQYFGRTIHGGGRECVPYIAYALFCIIWLNAVLSIMHGLVAAPGDTLASDIVAGGILAIPALLIGSALVFWGGKVLIDGLKTRTYFRLEANTITIELIVLGGMTVLVLLLPPRLRAFYTMDLVFLCLMGILFTFLNEVPSRVHARSALRFITLFLFAQVLWIPLAILFALLFLGHSLTVSWSVFFLAAGLCVVYVLISVIYEDFLTKGPILEISEGLVWLGFPVILFSIAEIIRLSAAGREPEERAFFLAGLVLGSGLLFLGFVTPFQFLRCSRPKLHPFPFSHHESTAGKVQRAFTFYVTCMLETTLAAFGPKAAMKLRYTTGLVASDKRGAAAKETTTSLLDPLNIPPQQFAETLRAVQRMVATHASRAYIERTGREIASRIHWSCRELLMPLFAIGEAPPREPLTEDERLDVLRRVHLFNDVGTDDLLQLASALVVKPTSPGQLLARQGTPCDKLTILADGVGRSEQKSIVGEVMIGAFLGPGDFFGEDSLQTGPGSLHAFDVRASNDVIAVSLRRIDFDTFCRTFPNIGRQIRERVRNMHLLRQTTVFKELSTALVGFVLARIRHETFTVGTEVIRQGEIGQSFYIVISGAAEVIIRQNDVSRKLAEISAGDYFGEIALIRDVPRTATVRAIDTLEVGVIDKSDFLSLRRGSKDFERDLATTVENRSAVLVELSDDTAE